jgi:hypothetical protein
VDNPDSGSRGKRFFAVDFALGKRNAPSPALAVQNLALEASPIVKTCKEWYERSRLAFSLDQQFVSSHVNRCESNRRGYQEYARGQVNE